MFEKNPVCQLLNIQYPIIQGGMVWVSGWRLASAVSNAGGLGVIGAGSMTPELLLHHISQCKTATNLPFGVNIPLIYKHSDEFIKICVDENVPVVITSAGNPKTYTNTLKQNGIKVIHVVSSTTFAQKAQEAGVDAIVAEGFEAGGHNGREETTTFVLLPSVVRSVSIPVIAAGGIATGQQMLATFVLGAHGVQIGTRFIATYEASAHENFKKIIIEAKEGDTFLCLKKLVPTRLYKNRLFIQIQELENKGASVSELLEFLGSNKSRLGIFEGDVENGMLEVGQNVSIIDKILSAKEIIDEIITDFKKTYNNLKF
ncbi:MAG: nitronate monooxygenase [Bacteroidales bacterium]|nr:nitronate monooxygenase [Bacteroidales bacterium]